MTRTVNLVAVTCIAGGMIAGSVLLGAGSAPSPAALPAATAQVYRIDPVHSSVLFRINHAGVGVFWGRFAEIEGTFNIDPKNPDDSFFDVTIPVASVDTNNEKRDEHLRSGDFFNARQYPTATFKSTSLSATDDDHVFELSGQLTIMGQTREVTTQLFFSGNGSFRGNAIQGFEVDFTIKRADFGITTYLAPDGSNSGGLGNDVRIIVAGEGVKQ
ncbi:MAG: polyisoprenoid-binding protein [Planctomycetota bacterium]|nr:MAG: polyisoprenoid-binding protein [Planctomycetota bacterium]